MKEKIQKEYLRERKIYLRQNYVAETLSKEWIPGLYPSLDIPDPFSSVPENLNKWTKEQEN